MHVSSIAGTTVKGAVDDLDLVIQILEEYGYSHDRFYIHCDGALFGLMMPFVKRVSIHVLFVGHIYPSSEVFVPITCCALIRLYKMTISF